MYFKYSYARVCVLITEFLCAQLILGRYERPVHVNSCTEKREKSEILLHDKHYLINWIVCGTDVVNIKLTYLLNFVSYLLQH